MIAIAMEFISRFLQRFLVKNGPTANAQQQQQGRCEKHRRGYGYGYEYRHSSEYNFQLPLHYPRYTGAQYEVMPEEELDCLLKQYGLPVIGDVDEKRRFAIGAFVWSN